MNTISPRSLSVLAALIGTHVATAQCANDWLPGGSIAGADSLVRTLTMWDADGGGPLPARLVLGGQFSTVASIVARRIATWEPTGNTWSALWSGPDVSGHYVKATTTLPNGHLVAGGSFTSIAGVAANFVARFDGTSWLPLGAGPGGGVECLATLPNGDVVAGGLNRLDRWNGSTWTSIVPGGLNGPVTSLAVMPNGDLIAAGRFAAISGVGVNHIGRWNGSTWAPLGLGFFDPFNPIVNCLTVLPNGDLVAGGAFTSSGPTPAVNIARWNGSAWSALGNGLGGGSFPAVHSLLGLPNGDLVAGGLFTTSGPTPANNIARWDGSTWSTVGSGVAGQVVTLALVPNGEIVAGGSFSSAGGVPASCVARWNGTAWSAFAAPPPFDNIVTALSASANGDVVAGGHFTIAGGVAASRVARLRAGAWSAMGAGVNGPVVALAELPNGDVVAGGSFTSAGGVAANNIARWNGAAWSPLGTGVVGTVQDLTVTPNGDLIVGGNFSSAGGVSASNIARWNGSSWSALGPGRTLPVYAVTALPNNDVVASGYVVSTFSFVSELGRWNGSSWSNLGSGISGYAIALCTMPNGDLIAGGKITQAGAVPVNNVARWDGATWSALGGGTAGDVHALAALPDGDLVAVGIFQSPGKRIARWNGSAWSTFGFAIDGPSSFAVAFAVAMARGGPLCVGGQFSTAGAYVAPNFARVGTTCPATAVSYGTGCSGAGGQNQLTPVAWPWIGSVFRARATGMPPLGFVAAVSGFTQLAVPLPLLFGQSGPTCVGYSSAEAIDVLFPVGGAVETQLAVPDAQSLVGLSFHQYMLVFEGDASGQVVAVTASNALTVTIGSF